MVAISKNVPLSLQAERLAHQHGVRLPLAGQPGTFLKLLWQMIPAGHLVGLMAEDEYYQAGRWHETVSAKWTFWPDNLPVLLDWAQVRNTAAYHLPGLGGVYYNAASRKNHVLSRFAARGSLDDLLATTAFYADLDVAARGYDLARALDALLAMPLPPTCVIFTGGGLHALHILKQPWAIPNRESAKEYKAYSLALYRAVFERTGLKLDSSIQEASRMLRLPGTVNRKNSRGGAISRIVHWDPDALYTINQIKAHAPLPESTPLQRTRLFAPLGIAARETYQVGQEFIHYLVDREPQPPERHPVILRLAMQAARAGMPLELFTEHMRPVAQDWFSENPDRAGDELDRMAGWAYERAGEDILAGVPFGLGLWLVRATPNGFERASEEEHDALRDKTLPTEAVVTPVHTVNFQALDQVRAEQLRQIREYVGARLQGLGTYMLVRTSPGAGKTHSALQAAYEYALRASRARGKVAILTQFTIDEYGWQDWLKQFGISDSSQAMYVVGRNSDQNSAGYCAMSTIADAVAAKGHNAVHLVCKRCPLQMQCEQSWYLSQFQRAKKKSMILARHQHGVIDELIGYRRLLVFDESPLGVVADKYELTAKDLVLAPSLMLETQYPDLVAALTKLLEALRAIIGANLPVTGHASTEHVKLGGRWLFDRLEETLGSEALGKLAELDPQPVQSAGQPGYFQLTVEGVANLSKNYLYDLWRVLKYEYETHYLAGRARWNSRLIPWGQTLRLYPMEPFKLDKLTKVIVADATGQPDLYGKAFTDLAGKPRQSHVYEAQLQPHARIVQWTNSGNSRRAFKQPRKVKAAAVAVPIQIESIEGETHTFVPPEPESVALARAKEQIQHLAEQHKGSLLVVTYLTIHGKLKKWAAQSGTLNPDYLQYYGNLRGRNDFKSLEAVLLIGEPRIPPMEVYAAAQVWYWDEELPIDFDLDVTGLKEESYPGYIGPDGKGRAYAYPGYKDPRLNRGYVWAIQAEMRQCYERIRANAPEAGPDGKLQPKFVYIAAQMPCTDHVDELAHWSQWKTDQVGRAWYEAQLADHKTAKQIDYIEAVMEQTGCQYTAARDSFLRIHAALVKTGKASPAGTEKDKKEIVLEWLTDPSSPGRVNLSIRDIQKLLPDVGANTIQRALKTLRTGDRSTRSHLI